MRGAVLVTDGEQRATLAVVRSLGRAGWRVGVCATRPPSLAGASRFAVWEARVPDALREPRAFVEGVARLTREGQASHVVPVSEAALLALLPAKADLAPATIPFPDADVFRRVSDKTAVAEAARDAGIRVPRQVVVERPGADVVPADLRFPVVVKSARSVSEANGRRVKTGVRYVVGAGQLSSALRELDPAAYPLLVQERVIGPGAGVFVLLWRGELVAAFAHRRLREKPPSGGVSVLRESVPLDRNLLDRSLALLRRFRWEGVGMVEYKLDAITGEPWIMEINGRFWGSLQLAVDAGVDFPRLLLEAAAGERPAPVTTYRVGVRSRWGWGDVDHLLAMWRRSREALDLPPDAPGRWASLWGFVRGFGPGIREEVLRRDDPRPFVRESLDWVRRR